MSEEALQITVKRREVKGKGEKERYTQRISRRDKTAFLVHETGCLGLVHWDDPEGWDGERGGRGVRDGNTCIPVVDSR